ncbi:MAG TPA: transposase [Roseovarius sp.]|nr:transposase [Roseovarius sp.]
MSTRPDREWWTAAEIAAAGLPDIPGTKRGVTKLAQRMSWSEQTGKSRRRNGRGGGREFHWSLFPVRAQSWLLAQAAKVDAPPDERPAREEAWSAFEKLPEKPKAEAASRLASIQKVEALERGGLTRDQAVRDVARLDGVAGRTIWNWLGMIDGVRSDDRLPYLAPRHRLAKRRSRAREIDPEFGALIKSDYLRPEQPSMSAVYDRCVRLARARGIEAAPLHTVRRWFRREVSEPTVVLKRKGLDALKTLYPAQVRDRSQMHAMEGVNGDYHRFDVFVRFPASDGIPEEIARPQMVAFQDLFSGRLLSWRVDKTPNSHTVQLCTGDMIERWGIPEHVLLDNGREFAAKLITGGTQTRYRFKVKEDDVPGLLTSLGCQVHWATPYSGQSKPIERAFRDLCDRVAKHPRLAGAYTGNAPDAKPENYGNRAVALEEFLEVLAEEIELHNMRPNRRSEVAWGRSFAEVFDESYAQAPIRKATEEQRRLWLMGAEGLRPAMRDGAITFMRNVYWADWLIEHRGEKVVARFDRAALWDGLHIYALSGEYLGHAECREKVGFFDVEQGRVHEKSRRAWMRAERDAADAHRVYTAAELGQGLAALDEGPPEDPVEARVVRMVPDQRPREETPAPSDEAPQAAFIADFEERRRARQAGEDDSGDDDPRVRFARALELERNAEAGEALTRDQRRWLASYQGSSEYRTWTRMVESHGEEVLQRG